MYNVEVPSMFKVISITTILIKVQRKFVFGNYEELLNSIKVIREAMETLIDTHSYDNV